jgi:hypothetical protein
MHQSSYETVGEVCDSLRLLLKISVTAPVSNSRLFLRYCQHLGFDPEQHLLEGEPADFESWIDWILRTTKKKTHETINQYWKWLCQGYGVLARRPMDSFKLEQVRRVRSL